MSTGIYVFIATKTTFATVLPAFTGDQADYNRRVRSTFVANAGGAVTVGDLKLRPTSDSIANHILCDGGEVPKIGFPELFAYIGDTQGAPVDPLNFVLPNYLTTLPIATTAPAQTVDDGGTVSTGGTVTTPTTPGQTGGTHGGNVPSGGRPRGKQSLL